MTTPDSSILNLTFDSGQPVRGLIGQVAKLEEGKQSEFSRPIKFQLLQVEVYESLIPWKFPQFEFTIPYSVQGQRWEVVAKSVQAIKGKGYRIGLLQDEKSWVRVEYSDGHPIRERVENKDPETGEVTVDWNDTTMEAWEFLAIAETRDEVAAGTPLDGETPPETKSEPSSESIPDVDLDDVLLELADGQDDNGFQQSAMTDTRIQGTGVFNDLMGDVGIGVLSTLQADNRISKGDDGFWHKT